MVSYSSLSDAMNGVTMIVGPLIGYAVTFYSGAAFGGGPWRLLYIVCGLCAFLLGIVIILFLPSSPMDARFLNDDEKRIALERIRGNSSGTVQKKLKWSQIREAIFDGRIWLALLFIALSKSLSFFYYFMIIITHLLHQLRSRMVDCEYVS
jgi:ACS family allantoate permease-like MFS transporter